MAEPTDRPLVVFLDHVARPSGAEIALLRVCDALIRHGEIRVHAILGEDGPLLTALQDVGADAEVLPINAHTRDLPRAMTSLRSLPLSAAAYSGAYCFRLARRLRQLQPDIIHSFSLKANLYGTVAARLVRRPQIWQANDRIADDYLPSKVATAVRTVAKLPAAVIANSEATLRTLGTNGSVVYPPLPFGWPAEAPAAHQEPGDAVIGLVGRLSRWKGQDVFLRAFAEAFRGRPVRGVIVGAALFDEGDWEDHLHELCNKLGIAGQVDFLGHVDPLWDLLASLAVLVHCSTLPEPFGQVVAEGMAMGLPIVAADAGGPREILRDGATGLLTPQGDAQALAAAMVRLVDDEALRNQLGAGAREAAQAFAPVHIAEQHMTVYRGVMDAK